MTVLHIEVRLRMVGASATEASDLAPIMHLNGWDAIAAVKPSAQLLSDCGAWLMDWRAERRQIARNVRADRQRTKDAGYRAPNQDAPVYIGCGVTEW